MPVLSPRRLSTSSGSTLLPPSGSYRSTYSTSSSLDRTAYSTSDYSSSYISIRPYRSSLARGSLGNDTGLGSSSNTTSSSSSSKYGVSKYLRSSADRDLPPTSGSRFSRSDIRTRDNSASSSYGSSSPSSTLRHITDKADLYEKYSPTHYTPKCELARSRSLSDANQTSKSSSISTTKDKTPTPTRDIISNSGLYTSSSASSSPTSSLSKVKKSCAPNNNNLITPSSTSINNKNNSSILTNNNNNVTNNQAFGLKKLLHNANVSAASDAACIAKTNAATIFIDSIKNKTTTDVGMSSTTSPFMTPASTNSSSTNHQIQISNNNLTINGVGCNNFDSERAASGKILHPINIRASNDFNSYSRGAPILNGGHKMTTDGRIYDVSNRGSSYIYNKINTDLLKPECDSLREQLTKPKSNEINNNSSSNNHHQNSHSLQNGIGTKFLSNNNLNGISKLALTNKSSSPAPSNSTNKMSAATFIKPLLAHSKVTSSSSSSTLPSSSLRQIQNKFLNSNSTGCKSELEFFTNKVLNKKLNNKQLSSTIGNSAPNIYQSSPSSSPSYSNNSNTNSTKPTTNTKSAFEKTKNNLQTNNSFDEIKYIDSDEHDRMAKLLNIASTSSAGGMTSTTTLPLVPKSTSTTASSSSSLKKTNPFENNINSSPTTNGKYYSSLNELSSSPKIKSSGYSGSSSRASTASPVTVNGTTTTTQKDVKIFNHKIEIEDNQRPRDESKSAATSVNIALRSQSPVTLNNQASSSLAASATNVNDESSNFSTLKKLSHDRDGDNDSVSFSFKFGLCLCFFLLVVRFWC